MQNFPEDRTGVAPVGDDLEDIQTLKNLLELHAYLRREATSVSAGLD